MKRWWSCIEFTYSHEYLGQPVNLHSGLPSYRQGKWDAGWLSCLLRSHRLSCIQTVLSSVLPITLRHTPSAWSALDSGWELREGGQRSVGISEKASEQRGDNEERWRRKGEYLSQRKHSTGHFGSKRRHLGRHFGRYLTSYLQVNRQSQKPHCYPGQLAVPTWPFVTWEWSWS